MRERADSHTGGPRAISLHALVHPIMAFGPSAGVVATFPWIGPAPSMTGPAAARARLLARSRVVP